MWGDEVNFSILVGQTLTKVEVAGDNDRIDFETREGKIYFQHHDQDCCESVQIEDVCGDLADLIGSPILTAEESTSETDPDDFKVKRGDFAPDSLTWTFYRLSTIKGSVVIRWRGESNGYYSERVSFEEQR